MTSAQNRVMFRRFLAGLVIACGCTPEGGGETHTTGGTGPVTDTAEPTTGTTGSTGNTEAPTSGSTGGGGLCEGPEHEAFQKYLCPQAYPSCTPYPPGMGADTYCQDHGIGPVGSGDCACTPRATLCGEGPDEMTFLCCCPLEDLKVDP
jgi:hypothetical protein